MKQTARAKHGRRLEKIATREKISADGSEKQTRETVSNALKTKLKEQMAEFQVLREKLRTEHKEVIEEAIFCVDWGTNRGRKTRIND